MPDRDTARKSFDLRLASVIPQIREEYDTLLIQAQIEGARANRGRTITITTEMREQILTQAERIVFYGHVDPRKMERDWEAASKGGRDPIGGAQDD